ncbi:glucuronate isomerase [Lonepinella koalarum]|uniref:Uronate isomerase n=1 Tax=Lonepinella koalarum TaxID=53417 RepID=A0A4R1L0G9_9PAST|nr:glucuronate isomerase [Lonepinella koalarum]MDH2926215.1 uronate isomerase [Lonepinella koalarum]TCK71366.1 D-glucuronate isomerase [Lonepinella koalarum]TFJ91079.1 glucuronate isomerase [Lonepinella koalarum]
MKHFLTKDFLLDNEISKELFFDYAENQPIFDYHCHLPPQQIAEDYQFKNLYDIWLKGDHYKWRAMRTHGVEERFCTGDATDYDKFLAWCETVPYTIGNPLYHWTHLELRRPFGITDTLLSPQTAQEIWHKCNALLEQENFSAKGIITQMNVKFIGTTDDPVDNLQYHKMIATDKQFTTKVTPSFRPDKAFNIEQENFNSYIEKLGNVADVEITSFTTLCDALTKRIDYFAMHGCKVSDHALDTVPYADADEKELNQILDSKRSGHQLDKLQIAKFKTAVLVFLAGEYHKRNWVQQYHIGALRNSNTFMFNHLGPDTGFDSINDEPIAQALAHLLDAQGKNNQLPKTILYCLNPRDNEVIATMLGNFQQAGIKSKMQFGSGWWFNDQKDGMIRQMTQLSQLGLLSHFVGMLTDSRSFLSYTRHEYFRRILCQMLGHWVRDGEAPHDIKLLGQMVSDICFNNARNYFEIELN